MSRRRFLSLATALCMLASMLAGIPAAAAEEYVWVYTLGVNISNTKDANTSNGNLLCKMRFGDDEEVISVQGVNKKGASTKNTHETTRAPWTLDSITFENNHKDAVKIRAYYLWVRCAKKGNTGVGFNKDLISTTYPNGTGEKDGKWLDTDDHEQTWFTHVFTPERNIQYPGNFKIDSETVYISDSGSDSGSYKLSYDGKVSDQYNGTVDSCGKNVAVADNSNPYYCMDMSGAPKISYVFYGQKKDGGTVNENDLQTNAGFSFDEKKGFEVSKSKLAAYMNKYEANKITVDVKLKFPSGTVNIHKSPEEYTKTITFIRKAFSVDSVSFSSNKYVPTTTNSKYNRDNNFYNSVIKNSDGTSSINVKVTIKTGGNNEHLYPGRNLDGASLSFDEAYISLGGSGRLNAKEKNVKVNGISFMLNFPYDEKADSDNKSIELVLRGGKLKPNNFGGNTAVLRSGEKEGYSYIASVNKVDAVRPDVTVSAADGTVEEYLSKWHKTATLTACFNESIYSALGGGRTVTEGYALMELKNGDSSVSIYDHKGKGTPSATQRVPAAKNTDTEITLRLRDAVEGSFTLVFSGKDAAGNPLEKRVENVHLDNKPPEIAVEETCGLPKSDGSRSNSYSVKITDASKTGRLYYCFTDNLLSTPEFNEAEAQKQTSGVIDSTLNKWAYIDQAETENGNTAAAVISVDKGKSFKGRLVYFAKDEADNTTESFYRDININNEDTACSIDTESDSAVPQRNYKISVRTNENNKIYYRWQDSKGSYITDYVQYGSQINTADNEKTSALSGAYTLKCKIVPPSGEKNASYAEKTFAFDNEGPSINVRSLTPGTSKSVQTISVSAADASGIEKGFASVVNPDGTAVEGLDEFELSVADGAISQNISISSIPNGAYALKVRATDKNGLESSSVSELFGVRSKSPELSVSVKSDTEQGGLALIASPDITLVFDGSESFKNASEINSRSVYFRVGDSYSTLGEWTKLGMASAEGDSLKISGSAQLPSMQLADGKNKLCVQAAVYDDNGDTAKINVDTLWSGEIEFYYDETAPLSRVVIDDRHTADSIEGKVYLSDNLDFELKLTTENPSIKIEKSETETNVFNITVTESVENAKLSAQDAAGNKSEIPITIKGIDKEAPTAAVKITSSARGARTDASATVTVSDAAADGVKITVADETDYKTYVKDGKIDDALFEKATADGITIKQTSEEEGTWDGEKTLSYNVRAAGLTGNYYICVRAEDSVGNTADTVFSEPLAPKDAELSYELSVNPVKAGTKSIARLKFNMPVYVLPQDKIRTTADTSLIDPDEVSGSEAVVETNINLAKQLGGSYSQDYSFTVQKNGEYLLYTVDDLGRGKLMRVSVEGIEFNSTGGLKAEIYDNGNLVTDYSLVNPNGGFKLAVTAEKAGKNLYPVDADMDYPPKSGLRFSEYDSEKAENGNGYTKLVYDIVTIEEEGAIYSVPVKSTERLIEALIFDETNTDTATWETESLVLDGIDNTPPETSVKVTPEIFVLDEYDHPEKIIPTAGNVVFDVTVQDAETGVDEIVLFAGWDEKTKTEIFITAPIDKDCSSEAFVWDGAQYDIPVKIEYRGDNNPTTKKRIRYIFSENGSIPGTEVRNKSGNRTAAMISFMEGLGTGGAICRLPLEENKDYRLKYYYENSSGEWIEIADTADENTFYKKAKAVLEAVTEHEDDQTRAEIGDREIRVTNNNGAWEKILDSFERTFTFKIKDKFGYTKDVEADALDNFDCTPGTIDYELSETGKTNKDIKLTVTAKDDKSGVGRVMLVSKNGSADLAENGGVYECDITENGTYSIVMLDRVGNKAAKNFSVGNIDKTVPTAEYELSTDKVTARPVSATLIFSKPNVRITRIEYSPSSVLRASDYSVNYTTSTITFTKSGTVDVYFTDEFGNEGVRDVTVANIDTTPPALEAIMTPNTNQTEVSVTFDLAKNSETGEVIDKRRTLGDVTVAYGGMARKAEYTDEKGNIKKAEFVFCENGFYTFKTYDDEGTSAYLTVEINGIDTKAPVITQVRWSYDYDVLENGAWQTKTYSSSIDNPSEAGYRVASDKNPVTNNDVTVTVVTDDDTRNAGSSGDYKKENEKVYKDNGLYIFNMEKPNLLTDSYGVDIEIIDKVPPVIDLFGKNELVFYENSSMGEAYSRDMLDKAGVAFNAYDAFGKGTDLNADVRIDWGGFDPSNLANNKFDSGKPYTITYTVSDKAHNITEAKRTVRLVGMYDTVALINGNLPDASGRSEVEGGDVTISLKNISPSAAVYVRHMSGLKTMGQMKKSETVVPRVRNGSFTATGLSEGWHTFYVQTDKRDYFVLQVYVYI